MSAIQVLLKYGRTVRTFVMSWVFTVEGCPLSGVPLYFKNTASFVHGLLLMNLAGINEVV